MIPRLQARGTSFKGSCAYVLNDPKAKTQERVAWILTQNLNTGPDDAWFEMYETWRNQAQLKANAGLSARGRKNERPVLHYTLAWHEDDQPTADQMREAALASLVVLGLEQHEAIIAAHSDKKHPHLHIVANTVHPYTGRTAELKFSKERLSEWAEKYERDHGRIHCEERVVNNEKRRDIREERRKERLVVEFAKVVKTSAAKPMPYVAVKHRSPSRPRWLEKNLVIAKMRQLRAELDSRQKTERLSSARHYESERIYLDNNTTAAIDNALAHVKSQFQLRWRELYRAHRQEQTFLARSASHPLERAVFIFRNRKRLFSASPMTLRSFSRLTLSGKRLSQAVNNLHQKERRTLGRSERLSAKTFTDRIMTAHRERFRNLLERQMAQREAARLHHVAERKSISFARAKGEILREFEPPDIPVPGQVHANTEQQFNHAAWAPAAFDQAQLPNRAERIRQDMKAWRMRNPDRDFGMEL